MERRSCWCMLLFLIIALAVGLVGYIHYKRELVNKLNNEMEFSDSAVREAVMGVQNFGLAVEHTQKELDNTEKEIKELQDEVGKLNPPKEEKDKELKACKDLVAGLNNDIAAVEKDKTDTEGNFAGEKTKWEETTNGLKKQMQETSPVCAHLKKDSFEKEPSLKDICPPLSTPAQA
ncbi:uncharacterized protein si:ch73-347e22.8 [Danio aesculapii]|uniref:uncharacterized protein si:ch73-347e22.8 n=1 Tax=Danio aesculapii TaxID=1142201 RepID=UPI0024BF9C49|nr:uncharacterized protein si:ch73-347e22.8 [Danio aesculapii]